MLCQAICHKQQPVKPRKAFSQGYNRREPELSELNEAGS